MNNNLKNKPIIKSRINNLDLKEKSVCLVSYASYMYDKKYGSVIDSNDVVVRINNGLNILNEIDSRKRKYLYRCILNNKILDEPKSYLTELEKTLFSKIPNERKEKIKKLNTNFKDEHNSDK